MLTPEQMMLCGTGATAVRDKYDGCCVHWAAGCGHLQCLQWLVEVAGADPATKCRGSGRQPSHYAARNGHLDCLQYLMNGCGCDLNALAKHGVTPLQLAVWQNQQHVAEFLCQSPRVLSDPLQVNSFACSLVHWLATATPAVGGEGGVLLLPMAEWLLEQGCDYFATQRSGHTVLHKAAWGGHLVLCRWLHYKLGVMDSVTDNAGNFAADCAAMGRHEEVCSWLREVCSTERGESLRLLGLDPTLGRRTGHVQSLILGQNQSAESDGEDVSLLIRNAYLDKARQHHPDRCTSAESADMFVAVKKAYEHLTVHGGRGRQHNDRHDIKTMITSLEQATRDMSLDIDDLSSFSSSTKDPTLKSTLTEDGEKSQLDDETATSPLMYFKARLLATLLDYGSSGMPASSLRKKWNEIWPDHPFPSSEEMRTILGDYDHLSDDGYRRKRNKNKKIKVLGFLKNIASDCCRVEEEVGMEPMLYAFSHSNPSL